MTLQRKRIEATLVGSFVRIYIIQMHAHKYLYVSHGEYIRLIVVVSVHSCIGVVTLIL